jgi:hypothetical protein
MTIDSQPPAGSPTHAGFGPVLNVRRLPGRLPRVALAGPPLSARAGALVAGVMLALTVLALPGGAIALAAAQVNPALTARNSPSYHIGATTHTAHTTPSTVTDPRR